MEQTVNSAATFSWFRKVALAEGISFLILLFIAMPLKYFAGLPMMVTIVGSLHGILVVAFFILLWETKKAYRKSWNWTFKSTLASFVPFGTFVMDKQWKKEEAEISAQTI